MTVQASDGGQLHVQMPREPSVKFSGPYVELVASVMNATTVKIMSCIDLGPDVGTSGFARHFLWLVQSGFWQICLLSIVSFN
ncbi:hypothetical protein AX17_001391 [Amanita inopinata Kibby_2008]|nr:hypothetical protein AX17_001391 [Amanita inopinata Kibby_2008]